MLLAKQAAARTLPEYTAAEAPRHIGEKATVVGKVECIGAGRTYHYLQLDACSPNSPFQIIVNDNASGPELNIHDLKGVTIAVTGKIESQDGYPWIVVKSTTQIQPRSPLNTDHISHADQKVGRGDLAGAIEEFRLAIEQQPDRRKEAYESIAWIKAKQGDWDGAIADYNRTLELFPNSISAYLGRGDAKAKKGDSVGALADYENAIAISPTSGDALFRRAQFKLAIGDFDGVIADCDREIQKSPKNAQSYGIRGEARKAKGDFGGAVADFRMASTLLPDAPFYKSKLKQAQAEAAAKKVAITQPTAQAAQNEQFSNKNKDEVSPESIAEAFVQAYSGADVDALASLYADRVDHTNSGVISNAAVRAQAKEYFARWPVRQWSLAGPVKTTSMGLSQQKVVFSASYDASNPQTNTHASGIAKETLIVAGDANGAMKIVSQKEQTSKKGRSQPGEETAEDVGLNAARAEYEHSSHDEAARVQYVTKLAEIYYQFLKHYSATGDKSADYVSVVFNELKTHPMPRNVDPRKLRQLLIGEWNSPRHTYVFRADGTYGISDEQRDKWRIQGNQLIEDGSRGTIILLDAYYFIYSKGESVFFHSRVKE